MTASHAVVNSGRTVRVWTVQNGIAVRLGRTDLTPPPPVPDVTTLLSTDWEFATVANPISLANFRTGMGDTDVSSAGGVAPMSIANVGGTHNKVIQVTWPANDINNGQVTAFVDGPFTGLTVDEAWLEYDIKFPSDMDWSMGGKLPGLGGVAPGVSPSTPTGGNGRSDVGWSCRHMWHGSAFSSGTLDPDEGLSYFYNPDQRDSTGYGDDIMWGAGFVAGQWHNIKQHVVMNTVGQADGVLQDWLDGNLVIDKHNARFRTQSIVHVSHLYWHLFRGGNTINWAGSVTNTVQLDNVKITIPAP